MVVPVSRPLQIIHAQAMHEYDQLAASLGNRGGQSLPLECQGLAVSAQAHGNGERVVSRSQIVTHYAVQRSQHGFPLGSRMPLALHGDEWRENGISLATHQPSHRAHGLVNQTRSAARGPLRGPVGHPRSTSDGVVHRLYQVSQSRGGVNSQPAEPEKIGRMNMSGTGHGSSMLLFS